MGEGERLENGYSNDVVFTTRERFREVRGVTFDHTVYGLAKLHKRNRIFACQNIGVG